MPPLQETGQLPTELPYEEHGHQEDLSYQTQFIFRETTPTKLYTGTGKEVHVWDSLVQPGVERIKHCGKTQSLKGTQVFVPMAMAVVSATEAYEETADCENTRASLPPRSQP